MNFQLPDPGVEPCIGGLQPAGCSVENGKALVENLIAENRAYRAMMIAPAAPAGTDDTSLKQCLQNLELRMASLGGGGGTTTCPIVITGGGAGTPAAAAPPPDTSLLQSQLDRCRSECDKYREKYEGAKKYEGKYEDCKTECERLEAELRKKPVAPRPSVAEVLQKNVFDPFTGPAPPAAAATVPKAEHDALRKKCDGLEAEVARLRAAAPDCSAIQSRLEAEFEKTINVLTAENTALIEELTRCTSEQKDLERERKECEEKARKGIAQATEQIGLAEIIETLGKLEEEVAGEPTISPPEKTTPTIPAGKEEEETPEEVATEVLRGVEFETTTETVNMGTNIDNTIKLLEAIGSHAKKTTGSPAGLEGAIRGETTDLNMKRLLPIAATTITPRDALKNKLVALFKVMDEVKGWPWLCDQHSALRDDIGRKQYDLIKKNLENKCKVRQ